MKRIAVLKPSTLNRQSTKPKSLSASAGFKPQARYLFCIHLVITTVGYLGLLTPAFVSLAAASCWAADSKPQSTSSALPVGLQTYRLVFADDFDTLELGTGERFASSKPPRWYEGVWFNPRRPPPGHFAIANSELSLSWRRGQGQPDSSISTFSSSGRPYQAWHYGYFEARMKWKPVTGAWPAFWLIPVPPAVETGEIDIFEGQGKEPRTFFGTIHRWSGSHEIESSSQHNRFPIPAGADFASYHTYGLLWVPGRVTWYFDGLPLHSETTYDIFDKQSYLLILGMQEGVNWKAGDLTGVNAQTLTLTIDWVRVWQKPVLQKPVSQK
jgi:hypothetical protein